jgi:phospholipid/cholesterol/gamma-HCH transport system substrate-binding protein
MHREYPASVRILAGLSGIILLAATAVVLVNYGVGTFRGGYQLEVVFTKTSQGLDTSSDVRVRGVRVGTVGRISIQPDGRALMTLKLRPGTHIADTATASIEPISVFGPTYLRVEQGAHENAGPFLGRGGRIRNTLPFVELSGVLNQTDQLLQKIQPDDLAAIFRTFADSVGGLGPQFARILDNGGTLLNVAMANLPQADQFLRDLATLTNAFARQIPSVVATVGNLGDALPTINAHTDRLGAVLDGASRIASSLSGYLQRNDKSFRQFLNSAATALTFINLHAANVPYLLELLDQTVRVIGDAVRLPGPGGTLIGALYGDVTSNLCLNVAVPVVCQPKSP